MTDNDMRQTLLAICQILKTEFLHLSALDRGFVALFEALKQDFPALEEHYMKAAGSALQAEYPAARQRLEQLEALIQRLKV